MDEICLRFVACARRCRETRDSRHAFARQQLLRPGLRPGGAQARYERKGPSLWTGVGAEYSLTQTPL